MIHFWYHKFCVQPCWCAPIECSLTFPISSGQVHPKNPWMVVSFQHRMGGKLYISTYPLLKDPLLRGQGQSSSRDCKWQERAEKNPILSNTHQKRPRKRAALPSSLTLANQLNPSPTQTLLVQVPMCLVCAKAEYWHLIRNGAIKQDERKGRNKEQLNKW